MPNNRITYRSIKANSKLTDYSDLRETVINNAVKNIPQELKEKSNDRDRALSFFC